MKDLYKYVAVDYFATGEGRSVFLLITRAYPSTDDYEIQPSFTEDWKYIPGKLKISEEEIALREMVNFAGGWFGRFSECLEREEFFRRFGHLVPDTVKKMIEDDDQPGNLNFKTSFHFNFS